MQMLCQSVSKMRLDIKQNTTRQRNALFGGASWRLDDPRWADAAVYVSYWDAFLRIFREVGAKLGFVEMPGMHYFKQ